MQFTGIVNTASVVTSKSGGRTVDLSAYTEQVSAVLTASQDESLLVELGEGDVYTTVRRHFQQAGAAMGIADQGVCLRFRKLVENGKATGLLVSHGPIGSATEA